MPGSALGTACRMAAGTAMYEALAPKTPIRKRFPGSWMMRLEMAAALSIPMRFLRILKLIRGKQKADVIPMSE